VTCLVTAPPDYTMVIVIASVAVVLVVFLCLCGALFCPASPFQSPRT